MAGVRRARLESTRVPATASAAGTGAPKRRLDWAHMRRADLRAGPAGLVVARFKMTVRRRIKGMMFTAKAITTDEVVTSW